MLSKILNTFGAKSITALINLLIAVLLSRYLGPDGKGIQSLILTTITLILVFANLVGGATLVYLVPRYPVAKLIVPAYAWTLFTGIVSALILWFFPLVERSFILHVCILSVLNAITSIHISVMIGKEKINQANHTGLIQPVTLILALSVFFKITNQHSISSYINSLYISFISSLIISIFWFRKCSGPMTIFPVRDYLLISRDMVRYGALNQVAHITQMLSFRLSYYVLDQHHGAGAVGVYSNGISLAESIWLIAKSISLVQYARISNLNDREESARLTIKFAKASLIVSLVLIAILALMPARFYTLLFGEGFEDIRLVIWALAPGVLFYNYSILIGHYFSGTGRYHINAITSSVGLVFSVILYFTLIPSYGYLGAGLATSASYLITSILFILWFSRDYRKWYSLFLPSFRS